MTKHDVIIYLKNFKRIFDITTKNVYFHLDNYGDSTCYYWEYNKLLYSYNTIYKQYEIGYLNRSLETALLSLIEYMPDKKTNAYIVSFINIEPTNEKLIITMTVATKPLV